MREPRADSLSWACDNHHRLTTYLPFPSYVIQDVVDRFVRVISRNIVLTSQLSTTGLFGRSADSTYFRVAEQFAVGLECLFWFMQLEVIHLGRLFQRFETPGRQL